MEFLTINGGRPLNGEVQVSGAKNAALPLLFASLLASKRCLLRNVPDLEDIRVTLRLLRSLGAEIQYAGNAVNIFTEEISATEAPYSQVKALRASFWALGPLLARAGEARVALPGGDAIGTRPVDLHLQGLSKLGAEFNLHHGVVIGKAPGGLRGAEIELAFPSVGATHNILMAASLARGQTIIRGAACEPEVVELAEFLRLLGAQVEGEGTACIAITGREQLGGVEFSVIGDRIEAATYLCAGAVTGGTVKVSGVAPKMLGETITALTEMGCVLDCAAEAISIRGANRLSAVELKTGPHPGLATDVQPLLMAALTRANGRSRIRETIFESRFGHVSEYRRLGAKIIVEGREATVEGVETLSGAPVEGLDIRAAAGLVLMGLMAEGITEITDIYHLDRGYAGMVEKLQGLGAAVKRVPYFGQRELVVGC